MIAARTAPATLYTVGYEGRAQHDFLSLLVREGIERLVDVRIRAQSRKPGFSKSALASGLEHAGLVYEHLRALGTPLDIRGLFRAGELEIAREQYREHLLGEGLEQLERLWNLVRDERVAIMCFEFDERTCHRLVICEELQRLHGVSVVHLRT